MNHNHLGNNAVPPARTPGKPGETERDGEPRIGTEDPGGKAREKVTERKTAYQKLCSIMKLIKRTIIIFVILVLAGVGWRAYNTPGKYVVDHRPCRFVDETAGIELTGTRSYSYTQYNFEGYKFSRAADVQVKTGLDVKGAEMTVLGVGGSENWSKHIGQGERYTVPLPDAEMYIFVIGKRSFFVNQGQFCH